MVQMILFAKAGSFEGVCLSSSQSSGGEGLLTLSPCFLGSRVNDGLPLGGPGQATPYVFT